jgi:SAM-dependent methyltransferase
MTFPKLIDSNKLFRPVTANCLPLTLCLEDLLHREILVAPSTYNKLSFKDGLLTDGENTFSFKDLSPILYPTIVSDAWINGMLPLDYHEHALKQYVLLSQIKQRGEINAPLDSIPARKHQWRYKEFCRELQGLVLDVGSDRPTHSKSLLPKNIQYIGLDPYSGSGEFRLIALGEMLPIATNSIDAVTFNTSLDHILDYYTAVDEAARVLRTGGVIIIATYAWIGKATLLTDSVHFHHFREPQIINVLSKYFQLEDIKRYHDPKNAVHRYGLYVKGIKK